MVPSVIPKALSLPPESSVTGPAVPPVPPSARGLSMGGVAPAVPPAPERAPDVSRVGDRRVLPAGRGRARYVPAALAGVVRRYLRRGTEVEAVLAEISAINAELLARRELR